MSTREEKTRSLLLRQTERLFCLVCQSRLVIYRRRLDSETGLVVDHRGLGGNGFLCSEVCADRAGIILGAHTNVH
jgi:hypothetical protein